MEQFRKKAYLTDFEAKNLVMESGGVLSRRQGILHLVCFVARIHRLLELEGNQTRMPHVKVKENEPFDVALRRFKRSCEKAGILAEVRRREYYEKPTAIRKRKAAAAVKRHAKKLQRESKRMERPY